MISEFDNKLHFSREDYIATLKEKLDYLNNNIQKIKLLNINNNLKYSNQQYNIGLSVVEIDENISPYQELLNKILSQSDIIKKYNDLLKFCDKYTHELNFKEKFLVM